MDAVEYLSVKRQICNEMDSCSDCLFFNIGCDARCDLKPETIISFVENWKKRKQDKEKKKRKEKFLEMFPDASLDLVGTISLCPCQIVMNGEYIGNRCKEFDMNCLKCCREYWAEEV